MTTISFAATGDSFITRRLPEGDEHVGPLQGIITEADVRLTNLEVVIRRPSEGFPSAESGGTWASAPPEVLEDLKAYGFNILSCPTNHTLDYSYGGLAATMRHLEANGLAYVGVGNHLAEASAVKYVECRGGRVGCIAATASCADSWIAGAQRPDMQGRPGVNPLRCDTIYCVQPGEFERLQKIASISGINAARNLSVKEGFAVPDKEGVFRFGQHLFKCVDRADQQGEITRPDARDMERIFKAIDEANDQADMVLVSIHAHAMKGEQKDRPADYLVEFARACIDRGAHAVVGHGPHIVRAVEIYNNRPIFYSLGNFIFQNDTVEHLPADFYEKYGLSHEHSVADALNTRSDGGRKGLGCNPHVWSSVVAKWRMENGELQELDLHPISLGPAEPRYRRGWPRLTDDTTVLTNLQALSSEFGTTLNLVNGKATWRQPSLAR